MHSTEVVTKSIFLLISYVIHFQLLLIIVSSWVNINFITFLNQKQSE